MTIINRSDVSVAGAGFGTVAILPIGFELLPTAEAIYTGYTVENAGPLEADDISFVGSYELGEAYRLQLANTTEFIYDMPNVGQNDYFTACATFRNRVAPGSTQQLLGDRSGGLGWQMRISPTVISLIVENSGSALVVTNTIDPTAAVWFAAVTRSLNTWKLHTLALSDADAVMLTTSGTLADADFEPGNTAVKTTGDSTARLETHIMALDTSTSLSDASVRLLAAGAQEELTLQGILPWAAE